MNYTEFVLMAKKHGADTLDVFNGGRDRADSLYSPEFCFNEYWCSGRISGGSCWNSSDDNRHYAIAGDKQPDLNSLDRFLLEANPNLSFLIYRNIAKQIQITENWKSAYEYYGNSTSYNLIYIKIDAIWEILKDA